MSALSVEVEWQTTVTPSGPALGISVLWTDEHGGSVIKAFSYDWEHLASVKQVGEPYSILHLLEYVLADRTVADGMLRANRYGLVMPCSGTVH